MFGTNTGTGIFAVMLEAVKEPTYYALGGDDKIIASSTQIFRDGGGGNLGVFHPNNTEAVTDLTEVDRMDDHTEQCVNYQILLMTLGIYS